MKYVFELNKSAEASVKDLVITTDSFTNRLKKILSAKTKESYTVCVFGTD